MTITLELAAILFLGTVTVYLLFQLGRAVKNVRYYASTAHVMHHSLMLTYKTLDEVLSHYKDAYPRLIESISGDFSKRMNKHMEEMEGKGNE